MKLLNLYNKLKKDLAEIGSDNPQGEASLILAHIWDVSREDIVVSPDRELEIDARFDTLWGRRAVGEPLSKIIGEKEFWSLPFYTNQHTLDPRADSEVLIETVLARIADKTAPLNILDIGTGTGCLVISLLSELPNAKAVACDISAEAIKVAQRNRERHDMNDRLVLLERGWNDLLQDQIYMNAFDVVISNPPYIDEGEVLPHDVYHYDPHLALFAKEGGLKPYKEIAHILPKLLKQDSEGVSIAIFEHGHKQGDDVLKIFQTVGFQGVKTVNDLTGAPRACLILDKKSQ